jgi:hypothetical protein
MRGATVFVLMAAVVTGCGFSRPPAPLHSEAMERSARMLRQLDKLEADLHQSDGETITYAELVERHGRAEQMACKVTEAHVEEIHRLATLQEQKIQQKKQERLRKRKAVAQLPKAVPAHAGRRHGRS